MTVYIPVAPKDFRPGVEYYLPPADLDAALGTAALRREWEDAVVAVRETRHALRAAQEGWTAQHLQSEYVDHDAWLHALRVACRAEEAAEQAASAAADAAVRDYHRATYEALSDPSVGDRIRRLWLAYDAAARDGFATLEEALTRREGLMSVLGVSVNGRARNGTGHFAAATGYGGGGIVPLHVRLDAVREAVEVVPRRAVAEAVEAVEAAKGGKR